MWGNKNIKDNELWGISPINFTELLVGNIVYCTYVTNKAYIKEFKWDSNIKLGDYLLNTLPNYVKKDTRLILKPDLIIVNPPGFRDLDAETLKYVIFGDINIANTAINIFGEDLLKGYINRIKNSSTQNSSFEIALVNFWNTTDLDIPFIWSVIADWVCENKYTLKKELCNKCLIHNYPDIPKLIHNSNLHVKIYYWYIEDNNHYKGSLMSSDIKPEKYKFSLNFISCPILRTYFKKYWDVSFIKKNTNSVMAFETGRGNGIFFNTKLLPVGWYITATGTGILILPPIASLPINLYPISGYIKTDFKIECPQCIIETDLDILACRSEYFNIYKNSDLNNTNFTSNSKLELKLDSQWDLRNLVNFIINCECEIKDPKLELQIADYYKCAQYKIYIDNWLKVNNLMLYYEIYEDF